MRFMLHDALLLSAHHAAAMPEQPGWPHRLVTGGHMTDLEEG